MHPSDVHAEDGDALKDEVVYSLSGGLLLVFFFVVDLFDVPHVKGRGEGAWRLTPETKPPGERLNGHEEERNQPGCLQSSLSTSPSISTAQSDRVTTRLHRTPSSSCMWVIRCSLETIEPAHIRASSLFLFADEIRGS